jgi:hypothetical protein
MLDFLRNFTGNIATQYQAYLMNKYQLNTPVQMSRRNLFDIQHQSSSNPTSSIRLSITVNSHRVTNID